MEHGRAVTVALECAYQRADGGVYVGLIGHGACGQEGAGVTGQKLVFAVGGVAAYDGGVHVAVYALIFKFVEEGEELLVGFKSPTELACIGKAFAHDDDDVPVGLEPSSVVA